jgi:phosphoglucomutase
MYYEGLVNITKKGKDGAEEIKHMMTDFRQSPKNFSRIGCRRSKRFPGANKSYVSTNEKSVMNDIPKSNVLIYYTEDGTKVCIRPSEQNQD